MSAELRAITERLEREDLYGHGSGKDRSVQESRKRKYEEESEQESSERRHRSLSYQRSWGRNTCPIYSKLCARKHGNPPYHRRRRNLGENNKAIQTIHSNKTNTSDPVPSSSSDFAGSAILFPVTNDVETDHHPFLLASSTTTVEEKLLATNSSKMESSPEKYLLEVLLSSPLFWKSRKICIFFVGSDEHIQEKSDEKTKDFRNKLNELALESKIWPRGASWNDLIDQHDQCMDQLHMLKTAKKQRIKQIYNFKALTTILNEDDSATKKPISVDTNKFTDLQGAIRNKFAPEFLRCCAIKEWCNVNTCDNWKFQFQQIADYWILRFPKMLPFMWEQYKHLDDFSSKNMAGIYPKPLRKYYTENLFKTVEDFPVNLFKALEYNLQEEGFIETLFSPEGSDNHLLFEFRTLNENLIDVILDRSFSAEISVSDESVTCEWYDLINGTYSVTDKRSTPTHDVHSANEGNRFSGNIIICNRVSDIEKFAITYFSKLSRDIPSKVIIFTRADFTNLLYLTESYDSQKGNNISNVINNVRYYFSETRITFGSTENKLENLVVKDRQFVFFKENLSLLSPNEDFVWDYILSNLKPDLISTVIKNAGSNLFSMHVLPLHINKSITKAGIPNTTDLLSKWWGFEKVAISELFKEIENANKRRVLLTGAQGWEKSQVLLGIANMIRKYRPGRYVIYFSMIEFLELVAEIEPTVDAVLNGMTNIISKNNIGKELVKSWLRFQKTVEFEIIFDAAEALNEFTRPKVLLILDVLTKNFLSVRLWFSVKDDLICDLMCDFPAFVINLDSLNKKEAISFLTDNWVDMIGIRDELQCKILKFYAKRMKMCGSSYEYESSLDECGFLLGYLYNKFMSLHFDRWAFIYKYHANTSVFKLLCDVTEMNDLEMINYRIILENLTISSFNISEEEAMPFLIIFLWYRNYKSCEFVIESALRTTGMHKMQNFCNQKKYGILHIFILSLIYALPDEDIPKLSEIQELMQFIVAKDPALLEQRDALGQTPLLLLLRVADSIIVDCKSLLRFFITDLKADMNACDDHNKNALHFQILDAQKSLSSKVLSHNLLSKGIVDRSALLDIYISLWEILYENGLKRNINQSSNDSLTEIPFSSVKVLGVSRKHGICFYKIRGLENTDVLIIDNFPSN